MLESGSLERAHMRIFTELGGLDRCASATCLHAKPLNRLKVLLKPCMHMEKRLIQIHLSDVRCHARS